MEPGLPAGRHAGVIELRRAAPFIVIVFLLALAGCTLLGLPSTERAPLALELQNAEARWAANGPSSYRFTIMYRCLCPWRDPITVTVEDQRVVDVTINGEPMADAGRSGVPFRVESAFEQVRRNLEADSIEATFDPELGYPVRVNVNPVEDLVDDEFAFEISDFEALP